MSQERVHGDVVRYVVAVRRPVQRRSPLAAFRRRWRARRARDRESDRSAVLDGADLVPADGVGLAVGAAVVLVVMVWFWGGDAVALVVLTLEALLALGAWLTGTLALIAGRPHRVDVRDSTGRVVTSVPIRRRRDAELVARVAREHIVAGASPGTALAYGCAAIGAPQALPPA
jgi:hypothetical protein